MTSKSPGSQWVRWIHREIQLTSIKVYCMRTADAVNIRRQNGEQTGTMNTWGVNKRLRVQPIFQSQRFYEAAL